MIALILKSIFALLAPFVPAAILFIVAVLLFTWALKQVAGYVLAAAIIALVLAIAWTWHVHEVDAARAAGYAAGAAAKQAEWDTARANEAQRERDVAQRSADLETTLSAADDANEAQRRAVAAAFLKETSDAVDKCTGAPLGADGVERVLKLTGER